MKLLGEKKRKIVEGRIFDLVGDSSITLAGQSKSDPS